MRIWLVRTCCLVYLFGSTTAFAQADLTEMVTFGDSLTHNDLLGWAYGQPQDMYGEDPMEAVFSKGSEGDERLNSYAIGGSESGDVALQIDVYWFLRLIKAQREATLFGFQIGGNDVLNNIELLAASMPGENPLADSVIDDIIENMRDDLTDLRRSHPDAQFVIWTVPDVTVTPDRWFDLTDIEAENVRAHVERANHAIRRAARLPFVVVVDLFTVGQQFVSNPPVIFGQQLVPPPSYGGYDHIFADEIHPTAVSNAFLANVIINQINVKWNDDIPQYTEEELADLAHIPY